MNNRVVEFKDLKDADLYIDCIYKGGSNNNVGDDPISKLLGTGNSGGFRKRKRDDDRSKFAFVALYTSMEELEWPDYFDVETGIFRYYGDNRKPGNDILNTKNLGNKLLEDVFAMLNTNRMEDIPPFFVFKKVGNGRDVKFLGLAVPGNKNISPDKDLVAFWRTISNNRFQNYEAYFTILNTSKSAISKKWINALVHDHKNSLQYAPECWKKFLKNGRNGIDALRAPKHIVIPNRYDQLQSDNDGMNCLNKIREHYSSNPYGFEFCSTDIIKKMDSHFVDFTLTRPWRDGGRDAVGLYSIDTGLNSVNSALKFECSLEAKCYSEKNSVGVRQMSRLISRIKYRQFGIMITTSFIDKQAYQEVVEDGHPILMITASDIASILRNNSINKDNVSDWLQSLDERENAVAEFL